MMLIRQFMQGQHGRCSRATAVWKGDRDFLEGVFKLLLNFTWWILIAHEVERSPQCLSLKGLSGDE
jgi:hypothetical protein